jgi:hypothetical protein
MGGAYGTTEDRRRAYKVWLDNLGGKDHMEDQGLDGSVILKRILKKWNGVVMD